MDFKKIEKFCLDTGKYLWVLLCGLVLTFNPEGATMLLTKLIGWALVIICAAKLIKLAVGDRLHWGWDAFYSGCCIAVGVILLTKPMIIANLIGRTMGIILLAWGLSALEESRSKPIAILTAVAGLVLVCIPASLTNTLLTLSGIIMTATAVVNIVAIVRARKRLTGGDPNIIDAVQ